MKYKGFTLIELLVVIVIIGILATLSSATYNSFIEDANRTKVQAEFKQIKDSIIATRLIEERTLTEITGSTCSFCTVCEDQDLRGISDSSTCMSRWESLLDRIEAAIGVDVEAFRRDPWGSPYTFDENEGDPSHTDCTQMDVLRSAGPDGIIGSGSSDNEKINIPFYGCN